MVTTLVSLRITNGGIFSVTTLSLNNSLITFLHRYVFLVLLLFVLFLTMLA